MPPLETRNVPFQTPAEQYEREVQAGNDTWRVWSKFVLAELARLTRCAELTSSQITTMNLLITKEITSLKIKVGLIGGGVGFALSIIGQVIIELLKK